MTTEIEKITCAAILVHCIEWVHRPSNVNTGYVIAWHRHHNCIETFSYMDPMVNWKRWDIKSQWFLTNKNRFVSRKEALQIARNANQLIEQHSKTELFSEDIY